MPGAGSRRILLDMFHSVLKPRVLFFNVNGSGLGHMNRCLSYALQMQGLADPYFFSLASAMEIVESFGFEGDYFVSPYWSSNTTFDWNTELSIRFGMVLEHVRPDVVVFDGTWPFQGFLAACNAYGVPKMVWSNRGLLKEATEPVLVDRAAFDLVIQPGELCTLSAEASHEADAKHLKIPPVCLLNNEELLDQRVARDALGLESDGRYVLFSLGPGNLKDVSGIGYGLIRHFEAAGFRVVWARPPISVRDVELPSGVRAVAVYPLARYMKAFDVFVGAAGYNTCCEVVQSQVPSLLVPNAELVDDQIRRAHLVADYAPVVVSACDSDKKQTLAVKQVLALLAKPPQGKQILPMNGAEVAAQAILDLVDYRTA